MHKHNQAQLTTRGCQPTLNNSDERFHLLSAALPVGVFYSDAFGHCLYVNRRWQEITGFSAEECVGEGWKNAIDPLDRERVFAEWTAHSNGEFLSEFRVARALNNPLWVRFRAEPMRDRRGTLIGRAGILENITELRQIELELARVRDEALQAARLKVVSLANMSHEIRTPLNGIMGMGNLLLDTPLNPEQRDYVETIRNSSESLLKILNDILDFSKIDAGKLTFEVLDFNLRDLLESTLELVAARAQSSGLELGCLIPQETPTLLRGDPCRLRQVLINLVANAIKFTERGEVCVSVSAIQNSQSDTTLRFDVRDTGIGITAEARQRLFQPFTQADQSIARKFGGTGLGLTISKQLVNMMHGDIGVESALGRGSTFWFTVRLDKQSSIKQETRSDPPEFANLRALVVSNGSINRQVLQEQLATCAVKFRIAVNASEALAILHDAVEGGTTYRLAILDVVGSGMEALQLAKAIKSEPALTNTHLILLTGWSQRFEHEVLQRVGIDDHLVKPVRQSRLLDALARVANRNSIQSTQPSPIEMCDDPQGAPAHKPRILLADDSTVNRKVALGQLKQLGYPADAVASGREVLDALERKDYDIVLMDVEMPELDGCETTRRIREFEGAGKYSGRAPVHIIAMTARSMEGDRLHCLAVGMNDYISKPVRSTELQAALGRWALATSSESLMLSSFQTAPATGLGYGHETEREPTDSSEPPVDVEHLKEIALGDPREMRDLVEFYFEQSEELLARLRMAVETGAAPVIRETAHKLAGSSATCGMTLVVPLLRKLEAQGEAGTLGGAAATLISVQQSFLRTQRFMSNYLQALLKEMAHQQTENAELPQA